MLWAAPAGAQSDATGLPPPVPSSYELRRLETEARQALAAQAEAARRKSRQHEYVGSGRESAAGLPSGLDLGLGPRVIADTGILAVLGIAAFSAFTEDTSPIISIGGSSGGGGGGGKPPAPGPGTTTTTTTTGTQ